MLTTQVSEYQNANENLQNDAKNRIKEITATYQSKAEEAKKTFSTALKQEKKKTEAYKSRVLAAHVARKKSSQ